MTDGRRRLAAWLWRPVDGASLAAVRILFGLILFCGAVRFVAEGWVEVLFVEPRHFLKYWGFAWVEVWPRWGMYLHYGVLAVLALAVTVGYRTRLAALLFFTGFTWVELMDVTNYLNHYYLASLVALLLVVVPSGRVGSLDARRDPGAPATVPAWCVYLLRFQVAVVYINAGLAKFGSDWLLHAQPLGIWLAARNETPLIGAWFDTAWLPYAMSWAGFLYDSTVVLFLSLRRTRLVAFAVLVFFHTMTHVLFDIGVFPFLMTALATIFFAPDWPRALLRRLGTAVAPAPPAASPVAVPGWTPLRRAAAVGLGVYCMFQVLLPLRHHLYPGSVLWHEQGMRWSWKVMLREKSGSITYHARDPETGRSWQVTPARYLTWRQANEMSGQPDLILQVAHLVADELRGLGVANPEVRAEAWVSLNGRPPALLIDPDADLAAVRDGVARADWILPEPDVAPLTVLARSEPDRF
jgi:hypothetical protein